MNEATGEAMGEALGTLIRAAANFSLAAGAGYKQERPEDWARLVSLFNTGRGELLAKIQISPSPHVDLVLVVNGQEQVFYSTSARELNSVVN